MALLVTKANGETFKDNGTDFETQSVYVFVVATFTGKNCLVNAVTYLNKAKKEINAPLRSIALPRKGNNPQGMVFACTEQTIAEAHNLLKEFYEQNGLVAEIVNL